MCIENTFSSIHKCSDYIPVLENIHHEVLYFMMDILIFFSNPISREENKTDLK